MSEKPTYEELKQRVRDLEKAETERKQAEDELLNRETIIQSIFDAAPVGICIMKNRVYQRANRDWWKSFGYQEKSIIGKTTAFLYESPEEYERVGVELYEDILKNGIAFARTRLKRSDGEFRDVDLIAKPLNPNDLESGTVVVINDITARKHTEAALQESEEKYASLANNLNVGVYRNIIGPNGNFIEANPAIVKMFGYNKREDFLKTRVSDLYKNPVEREKYAKKIMKGGSVKNYELQLQKKDGTPFIGSVSAVLVKDEKGEIKYSDGIIEDITERKQAEKALRESEEKLARAKKMESLGFLAGGVAHDLNNVLSGIVSYPELLLIKLPEDSELRKPIETIQRSGHRAAAIVQDLLTVARGVATTKEPLSLNGLVRDYINSPEFKKLKQFHSTVTVQTNLDKDLLNISGSHVHIRKVIMNLVSNASESIEGSGNVTISTMNHYVEKPVKGYNTLSTGEYVVLSVSDTGSGISPDDLERIFEPFYTKKVMGRSGTGLGLAVIWNVLQDHEGYIDVKSDENGTIFELYFPITRDEISGKGLSVPVKDYKGNGETILIVDDVESQREISCKMLDALGYNTEAVSSGEEAVEYLKEHSVELVLLDMIMDPGINGRETYERIIKIHPNQKAIVVSGYAETVEVKKAQKIGAGKYIKKPLTLEKIGIAVKEELGK